MNIKRIVFNFFVATLVFLTFSCNMGLNDMQAYMSQAARRSQNDGNGIVEEDFDFSDDIPEDIELSDDANGEGGGSYVLVKPDPFKEGDHNKDGYNGFILNPEEWGFWATFDGENRPTYALVKGVNWASADPSKNGYRAGQAPGRTTSGKGIAMSGVTYYQYRGKNPNFDGSNKYNLSPNMERFYFYRFEGTAAGQTTKNLLVAIDKKSKLVFAFGVPKKWTTIVGNAVPKEWGAVESGTAAWTNNTTNNFGKKVGSRFFYFYEYDPVGIVKPNGEILLYPWSGNKIASNNDYTPQFDGALYDNNRKVADYNGPGRSPYAPQKSYYVNSDGTVSDETVDEKETYHVMRVTVEKAQIWNHNAKSANRYAANGWMLGVGSWSVGDVQRTNLFDKFYNYAHIVAQMKMALSSDSDLGEGMVTVAGKTQTTSTIQAGLGYLFGSQANRDDAAYKVGIKSGKNQPIVKKDHVITYKDGDKVNLSFAFDIVKYDEPMGNYTQMEWPYWYCKDGEITVNLEYDDENKKFKYKSFTDRVPNRTYVDYGKYANPIEAAIVTPLPPGTTDAEAKKYRDNIRNFELPAGEKRSFKIVVNGQDGGENFNCGGKATGLNDDIEVIYQLKFDYLPDVVK